MNTQLGPLLEKYGECLRADLFRHGGGRGVRAQLWQIFLGEGGRYSFWMRSCAFLKQSALLKYTVFPIAKWQYRRACIDFGVWIPYSTKIDAGFHIAHAACIFINEHSEIGRNCTISQGVTLGFKPGPNGGAPILGEEVYVGPGAKIIGPVHVGNRVVVGANAVVTKDFPDDVIVAGVPAEAIGIAGNVEYIAFRYRFDCQNV